MLQPASSGAGKAALETSHRSTTDSQFAEHIASSEEGVRAFLRRLAGDGADADDAYQECLARAWRSRQRFDRERGSFKSWIMRIAFHSYLDQRDAHLRTPQLLGDEDLTLIPEVTNSPCRLEKQEEIDAALAILKAVEREVLLRFHRDQLSIDEIASELGLPSGTVKSHLHRARAKLREHGGRS